MRYLPHVEKAIARLGYIKPEYAPSLAILMEDHEGEHPHQIARRFRQYGTQLPKEAKRALGIRSNAEMSAEAADALTQRGLSAPLKGLETTVLDASFSYFRRRSVDTGLASGRDRFAVAGLFSDCVACQRLNGLIVLSAYLNELPPADCSHEACGIGLQLRIDFIQDLIDRRSEPQ